MVFIFKMWYTFLIFFFFKCQSVLREQERLATAGPYDVTPLHRITGTFEICSIL